MIHPLFLFICLWTTGLSYSSQQYYDQTPCSSNTKNPGTRYTCTSTTNPCKTFLIYRANDQFRTISTISNLFKINPNTLFFLNNNNISSPNQILETGHEVLIPIICSCNNGEFSQANLTYKVSETASVSDIACGVFEGLVKSVTLAEENSVSPRNRVTVAGFILTVPLKCACPEEDDGVKYLVTYPFIKWDDTRKVSEKFNVSVERILEINHLDPIIPTVYPNTTILVPLRDEPFINFNFPFSDPPIPQFLSTFPVEKKPKNTSQLIKKLCIGGSVVGFCLLLALFLACCLYFKALKKINAQDIRSLTPISRSSTNSCLSPDLLAGIKYNLCIYNVEDLEKATKNFSEDSKIGDSVYKGSKVEIGDVMIKRMRFEGTRQVINVHSKINHVNIVKLDGVCYGVDDFSWSYLVYEFPSNGSLRNCLLSSSAALHWHRRTQIAFDIAMRLHYLHYSIVPVYIHSNINCTNVFLTANWRAKITVFGHKCLTEVVGWIAPENLHDRTVVSEKVDVFSFGVVLLELISGKECVDRECIAFLGNEGGYFDELRKFVDSCLKNDYPIAEALCLVVLAGSCVEDEPLHRPSMDDVLKILARMV